MDYLLTDKQKALQKEWDDFYRELMKDAPKIWRGGHGTDCGFLYGAEFDHATVEWSKRIYDAEYKRGYHSLHWPKEYGGQEIGPVEQAILAEIKNYYRVPSENWAGLRLLAPALIMFGTEEQKKEFLPKILSGERIFCQVWSEPNAGSDLASLTTRAVRDGDDYIVNGQKTWIGAAGGAKPANWGHSPFRTDPDTTKRHRGLSYFMFPMDTPGITITDVYASNHNRGWSEIFFEDVRIPAKYRVGEENRGWYVTMATANFERSGSPYGEVKRDIEELVAYCVETKRNGQRLIDDPFIKEELAELIIEGEKLRALGQRSAWKQSKGEDVTSYASAGKIIWTELNHKMAIFVAHRLGGLYGMMRPGSDWALFDGFFENFGEGISLGKIINVGSNDIQHNVIANRGLKLPRE